MFYHYHQGSLSRESSIRVAESADPLLDSWHRGNAGKEVSFSEPDARDPHVIRDLQSGSYLMYYVCSVRSAYDLQEVVRVRTSKDLLLGASPAPCCAPHPSTRPQSPCLCYKKMDTTTCGSAVSITAECRYTYLKLLSISATRQPIASRSSRARIGDCSY